MITVVGIRFRGAGKIYSFDPNGIEVKVGDRVVVETVKGVELGNCVLGPREINEDALESELKPIIRIATEEDLKEDARHKQLEKEARPIFYEKMNACGLDMKLVEVEYFFDNSKIMFYYTSNSRVDFRELVKELAGAFHARIELRQIGVRNETQYFGGIGVCGRELCCHSFLADFGSVTIKMAKDQELPLTSTKISGVCGRLMCCLANEHESYIYLNENMPSVGDIVTNPEGQSGEVVDKSIIRQKVKVRFVDKRDEAEIKEYHVNEIKKLYTRKEYYKLVESGEIKPIFQRKDREQTEISKDSKNTKSIDRNISMADEKPAKYAKMEARTEKADKTEKSDKNERSEKTKEGRNFDRDKNQGKRQKGDFQKNDRRAFDKKSGETEKNGEDKKPNHYKHKDRRPQSPDGRNKGKSSNQGTEQ